MRVLRQRSGRCDDLRFSLVVLACAACGASAHPAPAASSTGDDLTLYRDAAVVRQRVHPGEVGVPDDVAADQVMVLGKATVRASAKGTITVDSAERDVTIGYTTTALSWDAAYTMTTTTARDRAVLDGTLTVRNASAVTLHGPAHVIDASLGAVRARGAPTSPLGTNADPDHAAASRDLGALVLPPGETRVPLVAGKSHRMRAVLVYDPIGTKLDNSSPIPIRDPSLGVSEAPSSKVTESFEIARDEHDTAGLPAGRVRLLERRADGRLVALGESSLFSPQTRRAGVDTIAIGTADGVTGHRVRRELTDDESRHRLVEEFVITLDNARDTPVSVLVREHLYRGQTWALGYWSEPDIAQEGAQAFVMRSRVPAKGKVNIMYVVVYTWGT
jgi:hypothetical protein